VSRRLTIAIDGPASSGKGTVARLVARDLGYAYIDTGAMYRSVALAAMNLALDLQDAEALGALAAALDFRFEWSGDDLRIFVDGEDWSERIRTEAVGMGASNVAVHAPVRRALLDRQRQLGQAGGVVMDGRDIGSVVLPDADLKVYLDASREERAIRRHREMLARGLDVAIETILREVTDRDAKDRERAEAPLIQAHDAVYLDTTDYSAEESAQRIVEMAHDLG